MPTGSRCTVPLDQTNSSGQLSNGGISYVRVPLVSGALVAASSTPAVPEPGTLGLIGLGIAGWCGVRLRKGSSQRALRT